MPEAHRVSPLDYLRELQESPKTKRGFNSVLRAWVDDSSEVARVLKAFDESRAPSPSEPPPMPRHKSPIPPDPRWWHHVLWRVSAQCAHNGIKVLTSSTLVVNFSYDIEAFSGRCLECGAVVRWSKRHRPVWPIRVIRKVRLPWVS